jgi:uncharacterized protein (DUF2236 family)
MDVSSVQMPGPGSMHWRYGGEVRGYLLLVKAGLLQLMHPGLGAGVEQHSDFFTEPWERVLRSVPQIQGTTFDWPDGEITARKIRDFHTHIKGLDAHGKKYHALDPDVFFWAHATIFDALYQMINQFDHPMSEPEKELLYREACVIYQAYGVSDRVMPKDWARFEEYFDRMCREELEITPAARGLIEFTKHPPETFPLVPQPIYRLLRRPSAKPLWWIGVGTLPEPVRAMIGERWTAKDEKKFDRFRGVVRRTAPRLPYRVRYTQRAREGFKRAGVGPT